MLTYSSFKRKKEAGLRSYFLLISYFFLLVNIKLIAQDNSDCLMCHEDPSLKGTRNGKSVSVFFNNKIFVKSVHTKEKCIGCHVDLKNSEFPHAKPQRPTCGGCHKSQQELYNQCMHGKAFGKKDPLAPTCQSCHGSHSIVPNKDKQSPVYPLNIPNLCGKCHKEGGPVSVMRNISQKHILENYSESIHGEGLLKKGLTVTATCASCHSPHRILPHTDSRSTISRTNIAATCTKCHASIENVHKKVIKGELWEKEAKVLPACIDCHQPHKARKVFYEANAADGTCRKCHDDKNLKAANGKSMFVNHDEIVGSKHSKIACSQCHLDVDPKHARPCDNIQKRVECASCHTAVSDMYKTGTHGLLLAKNDKNAPFCFDCHGSHNILGKTNHNSPIFPLNVPKLCSKCHQEGKQAAKLYTGTEHQIVDKYSESIHGKGLIKSGLTVTATCADCHTAHGGLPEKNPASSINPKNISLTCGKCHFGIEEKFNKSIHSPLVSKSTKKLPVCSDCHTAHTIKRTDANNFRTEILTSCGKCHEDIAETYFDTYHGKVSRLGVSKAAKCSDCHGSHDILPVDDVNSKLSRSNIIATCQKCHKDANKRFTDYFTHATHKDRVKWPLLFITFWAMTLLLLGTFTISFLHTLLWLPKSISMRKQMKAAAADHAGEENAKRFARFTHLERLLHVLMIISFLSLAVTGMILKFSYTGFAQFLATLFGGAENAGLIHRLAATMLFTIFIIHVYDLFRKKKRHFKSWKKLLIGSDSMVPNMKDLADVKASFKWFLGKGPRPQYGKWTYWEKFDYFAVFWGVFIIGSTGMMLWMPVLFTKVLPGWMVNIATIVHSDEALLAAGFIFTVHFFNTHFRPEKFPMDTVIFTGQMHLAELKLDRPAEYERLINEGRLDDYMEVPSSPQLLKMMRVFGFTALIIGLSVVVWIIIGLFLS
ncbi:MAG: cytochrome b/b6 domain-containing protein [Candidatus Kapabacteria bacterium]|nr:cytochrome b/b6 domain-containing protein [Candidatus Kapabacteria bacterium]